LGKNETVTLDDDDVIVGDSDTSKKVVVCKSRNQVREIYHEAMAMVRIKWCLRRIGRVAHSCNKSIASPSPFSLYISFVFHFVFFFIFYFCVLWFRFSIQDYHAK